MALPTEIMDDCCKKQRCLFGVNKGQIYSICDPCGNLGEFDEELCDCVSQESQHWKLEWMYAPITNPNCSGRPDGGYCELGPLEGPYYSNIAFPSGLTFRYIGLVGTYYNADCGGGSGPGDTAGGYCEVTGATYVNRGQGWQTCANAQWTLNTVSRMEWHGFQLVEIGNGSYGAEGDQWIFQLGPSSSGAVNCNETQYIVTNACATDSNFDCL